MTPALTSLRENSSVRPLADARGSVSRWFQEALGQSRDRKGVGRKFSHRQAGLSESCRKAPPVMAGASVTMVI